MKKNMGPLDQTVRAILAVVMAILVFTKVVTGVVAYLFVVLTIIFLITSLIAFCPLYVALGISTRRKEKPQG